MLRGVRPLSIPFRILHVCKRLRFFLSSILVLSIPFRILHRLPVKPKYIRKFAVFQFLLGFYRRGSAGTLSCASGLSIPFRILRVKLALSHLAGHVFQFLLGFYHSDEFYQWLYKVFVFQFLLGFYIDLATNARPNEVNFQFLLGFYSRRVSWVGCGLGSFNSF